MCFDYLGNRLRELEETSDQPATPNHARQLSTKLEALDTKFKTHHLQLIDLVDDKDSETLEREQKTLDKHDNDVTSFVVRLNPEEVGRI